MLVAPVTRPTQVQAMLPLEGIVVALIDGSNEVLAVREVPRLTKAGSVVSVGSRSVPTRDRRDFRTIDSRT